MNDHAKHRRRPIQFRLRTFFFVALAVAIVLPGLTAESDSTRGITAGAVELAAVVAAAVGAVYGRGYFQTFCIGALVPLIASNSTLRIQLGIHPMMPNSAWEDLPGYVFLLMNFSLWAACGFFAMLVRWVPGSRRRGDRPEGTEERVP